jgi:hypothetical protein
MILIAAIADWAKSSPVCKDDRGVAAQPGALARGWARAGAAIYDPFLALGERRGMRDRRAALLAGARGRVLEIGAGTGLNLPFYPPELDRLVLSEPEEEMARQLESPGPPPPAGRGGGGGAPPPPATASGRTRVSSGQAPTRCRSQTRRSMPSCRRWSSAPCQTRMLRPPKSAACCVPAVACCTSSMSATTGRWAAGRTTSHPRGPLSRQVVAAIGRPTTCSTAPSRSSPRSARSGTACPA